MMGNLGWYQVITQLSKKVGGPKVFLTLVATGGYVIIRGGEAFGKKIIKSSKKSDSSKTKIKNKTKTYTFSESGNDGSGFEFKEGEQYTIAAEHDDAILLEKLNDENNPYFVSRSFLKKVSDFSAIN